MFGTYLDRVRSAAPLIHNMTNYVTANDVANLLLACGASPIMAEDENEAEEVTSICAGLNLNIGTLSRQKLRAMLLAGKEARRLGHPVLLDPVGVGVSRFRMEAAAQTIERTAEYFQRMGLPARLAEVGIGEENFDVMAQKAAAQTRSSYVPLTAEDVKAIYQMAK